MKKLFILFVLVLTSGCANMTPEEVSQQQPKLDLYDYFAGETQAWGLFEDRFGRVKRQFQVAISGRIENQELVLEEDFIYGDGERERRVWRIKRDGEQGYLGTAADVIGEARGRVHGNALSWRYDMDLKVGEGRWRVSFDDWMFLQPGGVMINRARVKKFGLEIGSVSLFFTKPQPASEAAASASQ
jgi:hypothetical protein